MDHQNPRIRTHNEFLLFRAPSTSTCAGIVMSFAVGFLQLLWNLDPAVTSRMALDYSAVSCLVALLSSKHVACALIALLSERPRLVVCMHGRASLCPSRTTCPTRLQGFWRACVGSTSRTRCSSCSKQITITAARCWWMQPTLPCPAKSLRRSSRSSLGLPQFLPAP